MEFKEELQSKIFTFINSFQNDFKIHGNSHVARCLIYGNSICNLEKISDKDKLNVLYAISFHDSGRLLDYGVDNNDDASVEMLRRYLEKENKLNLLNDIKCLMYKHGSTLLNSIVYDTDVLDIMRVGCGRGGIYNFDRKFSKLIQFRNYGDSLIRECWELINMTEKNAEFDGVDSFDLMNSMIKNNNFTLLSSA